MNCPNCGAPMRPAETEDSLCCEYCRSIYTPEENEEGVRLLGEDSPLHCPVCAAPLQEAALASHRIRYCSRCEGMLVKMDDFVGLISELRAGHSAAGNVQSAADRRGLERHIQCPQCNQPMDTHFYEGPGNIIIDDCSHCFLNWLDKGELMRIVHAPDHLYARDEYGR
ncbi:MAG TPA: zf-TFIIB domain-containing protein [Bryobacteraceae bacterium]|nr:zf-TFIIB domain-containing protein [Bryobacteraceae bacterium]